MAKLSLNDIEQKSKHKSFSKYLIFHVKGNFPFPKGILAPNPCARNNVNGFQCRRREERHLGPVGAGKSRIILFHSSS